MFLSTFLQREFIEFIGYLKEFLSLSMHFINK